FPRSKQQSPCIRRERRGVCLGRLIAAAATSAGAAPATTVATPAGTAPATTVASPAAAATLFAPPSLIDRQSPAFDLLAVERLDGRLGFRVAAHFDEAKSFGPAGVTVHDHLRRLHGAMRLK